MEKLKKEKNDFCMMVVSKGFFETENSDNKPYWKQLKRQEKGDILLSCEKNYISVHKVVLVKASNYFNVNESYWMFFNINFMYIFIIVID